MLRRASIFGGCIIFFTGVVAVSWGEGTSAHDTLVSRGLVKRGMFYVLPDELEFSQSLLSLRKLDQQLANSARKQKQFDKDIEMNKRKIQACMEHRLQLNESLSRTKRFIERSQLMAQINALTDRMNLLREAGSGSEEGQRIQEQLGQARLEYVHLAKQLRTQVEDIKSQYAAFAQDQDIRSCLAQLNATRKREMKLGPRRLFLKNVKQLEKMESAVFSESVPLRPRGNVFWVDTVINGAFPASMILDTGAGMISIPAGLAAKIGLRLTNADPSVRLRLADGRLVEGKRTTLDSVSVGGFEVTDVPCVVLPPNLEGAPPLLGGAFLSHFVYKVDPQTKRLVLLKVETSTGHQPPRTAARK